MRDLEFWRLEEMITMCSELEGRVSLEILVLVQKLLVKMIQIRMIMYTDGCASVLFHSIAETLGSLASSLHCHCLLFGYLCCVRPIHFLLLFCFVDCDAFIRFRHRRILTICTMNRA